jgi:hypothetical protein
MNNQPTFDESYLLIRRVSVGQLAFVAHPIGSDHLETGANEGE